MTDHITRYTDRLVSAVHIHFQDAPVIRNKQNKATPGYFLPTLLHLFQKVQSENEGIKTDFTDAEQIYTIFTSYTRLVAEVNQYTGFVPTRTNFCAFVGINTNMYARLLQDALPDVRDAMQYIEDYFVSLLQIGSLSGDVGISAAKLVLQTSGRYGHNQVTTKEAADIRAAEKRMMSVEELEANLKRITAG